MTDTLFDVDERHPMFTYRPNPLLQRHREAVLLQLAANLTRFDEAERKNADIIAFCKHVHDLVGVANSIERTTGAPWLIGVIVAQRVQRVETLKRQLDTNTHPFHPMHKENVRRSINVITDLCERFVQAIAKGA